MAVSLNLRTHETRKIPGTTQQRLVRVLPYSRFNMQGEPPFFVQGGKFFSDEGKHPIKEEDIPEWVKGQIERMSPEGRLKLGLASPEDIKTLKKARRRGRNLATSKPMSIEDLDEDLDQENEE
jgi:hypothetical protein